MTVVRDMWAPLALVLRYYLTVAPHVRRELAHWRRRAAAIPDWQLRRFACDKLAGEHLNAEAAAVFATLVPHRHRQAAARLMVAFEVMYDYLDAVSEQPAAQPVRNGLRLHEALTHAIVASPAGDFYAFSSYGDDGGYLDEIAAACRARLAALPGATAVRPTLVRCAARCAEGQTRTHAVPQLGTRQLEEFGRALADDARYASAELTAAAASSLVLHALFAAAGNARVAGRGGQIERAYFPSVCALSTLLDAFIDQSRDASENVHNYVDRYGPPDASARRLAVVAADADHAVRELSGGGRQAAIVAGVSAFYLSAVPADEPVRVAASGHVIDAFRPATIRFLLCLVRLKRQAEALRLGRARAPSRRAADRHPA